MSINLELTDLDDYTPEQLTACITFLEELKRAQLNEEKPWDKYEAEDDEEDEDEPEEKSDVANVSSNVRGLLLDSAGTSWDKELHTRTKSKNPDGTWKRKEPLSAKTAPLPPPPTFVPPPPPGITEPVAPVEPRPVETGEEVNPFTELLNRVSAAITEGKLSMAQVIQCVHLHGVESLRDLNYRPDLIPFVSSDIDKMIGS
jgi:hypothetical protein